VRNDPLLEQFSLRLPGQFPCFRSNSYPSVQNWSTLQLNYQHPLRLRLSRNAGRENVPGCSKKRAIILTRSLSGCN